MTTFEFTKDLAAHIVYAEARHFTAGENRHGRSEDEVRTLTRRLSWLTDRDLHWCDVDELIDQLRHLSGLRAGQESYLGYIRFNIDTMLGTIRPRFEVAA